MRRTEWIRRAIDGELSPAQREELERRCARDEALAQELERQRALRRDLSALGAHRGAHSGEHSGEHHGEHRGEPFGEHREAHRGQPLEAHREQPREDRHGAIDAERTARIMSRIRSRARRSPPPRRLRAVLIAASVACALLLGGAVGYWLGSRPDSGEDRLLGHRPQRTLLSLVPEPTPPRPPALQPAGRCQPEVVRVRFSLKAEDANKVALVGDFNGWRKDRTLLSEPAGDGIWRVTLRLRPGTYQYVFLVDGERWVPDPAALRKPDGFGGHNSVIQL
jgi:hypothetical protein